MMTSLGRVFCLFSGLLTLACAQPTTSPCQYIPTDTAASSPWSTRDDARRTKYQDFYEEALQGLDGLTPEDLYTFVKQGTLLDFPVLEGDAGARNALLDRYDHVNEAVQWGMWTPLDPEGKLGRLHLSSYLAAGLPFEPLYAAALKTTTDMQPDADELRWRLCVIRDLSMHGKIPLSGMDWSGVESLWQAGASSMHSVSYRHYRQPSYVVLSGEAAKDLRARITEKGITGRRD